MCRKTDRGCAQHPCARGGSFCTTLNSDRRKEKQWFWSRKTDRGGVFLTLGRGSAHRRGWRKTHRGGHPGFWGGARLTDWGGGKRTGAVTLDYGAGLGSRAGLAENGPGRSPWNMGGARLTDGGDGKRTRGSPCEFGAGMGSDGEAETDQEGFPNAFGGKAGGGRGRRQMD